MLSLKCCFPALAVMFIVQCVFGKFMFCCFKESFNCQCTMLVRE